MTINVSTHLNGTLSKPMTSPQPGSLVSGKVIKWLGGQIATVNIGGQIQTAKIEGNLKAGDRYVFQVVTGDDTSALNLKLVEGQNAAPLSNTLFKQLGIALTPGNRELITYMMQRGVPLTPSTVKEWLSLTAAVPQMKDAITILDEMFAREFPLHPEIFQAIAAVKRGPGASVLLDRFSERLETLPTDSNSDQLDTLKQLLSDLQLGKTFTSNSSLPLLFEKMGVFHEAMLAQFFLRSKGPDTLPPQTLKGELVSLLSRSENVPNDVTQAATHLLHHLTGEQLLSLTHDPNWFSLNVQIPILLQDETRTDAKVKWEIKKAPDGGFDPTFCRLVFHVHLTNLKETILQMVVQDRQVSCTLYTEGSALIDPGTSSLYDEMKQRLHSLSFNLIGFYHREESLQAVKKQLFYQASQMDVSI
ncbi:MAG TPA: hypothetical protein VLK78_01965 [Candidatus Angelobacter sp.]|nr:hypothetical protein [Candidatus Angelobacter sp.]